MTCALLVAGRFHPVGDSALRLAPRFYGASCGFSLVRECLSTRRHLDKIAPNRSYFQFRFFQVSKGETFSANRELPDVRVYTTEFVRPAARSRQDFPERLEPRLRVKRRARAPGEWHEKTNTINEKYFSAWRGTWLFSSLLWPIDRARSRATFGQPLSLVPNWFKYHVLSLVVALALTSDQEEVLESICGGFDGASRHGSPTSGRHAGNHGVLLQSSLPLFLPPSLPGFVVPTLFLVHFREAPYDTP